jgi:cell division protein FtsQ
MPSFPSVVTALALAALGIVAYGAARETSMFAVRSITVAGAPAPLAADVRRALLPLEAESLVGLRSEEVTRLARSLPEIASVSYDRAFPHTLAVVVEPEQPLAVARRGTGSWLVSRTGRVVKPLPRHALSSLPRIWLPKRAEIAVGSALARDGADAVAALAPISAVGLQGRVSTVRVERRQITYVLRGGVEIRAGTATALPLKLTIARRVLAETHVDGYLDVSVPERPVADGGPQAQPEV